MICPKCHKEIPDGSKFCLECGSTVSGESAEALDGSVGDGVTLEPDRPAPLPSIGGDETIQARVGDGSPGIMTGTRLTDRYEPGEEIGSGGFARVFVARDRKLGRTVAVKRLRPEHVGGKAGTRTVERFVRESQAIAGLNHRNIVQVFDADRDPEGYYIVMEYVDGGTLRDYLKAQGTLDLAEALPLFRGVAQGLAYAHRHNLVHRDMKPANILLGRDDGELVPKIVDFGLARAGADSDLSMTGYGMGTPFYMPPEQRRDAKGVNHTADIYALGKILYEMVSGEIPDNVDPEAIPPPPELAQIIFRAIKSRPEERYFSVEDLLRDLDALSATDAAPSNTGTGRSDSTGNPCPSCGASNPPDGKFCEQCGTGLTRICPECERENSIHKRFCAGCGTDVEGFVQVRDALANMQRYAQDGKWSRVLKEAEELPGNLDLKSDQGVELLKQVGALKSEAKAQVDRNKSLRQKINRARAAANFKEALKLCSDYLAQTPGDEEVQAIRDECFAKSDSAEAENAYDLAQRRLAEDDLKAAMTALEAYLREYSDGARAEEATDLLAELRIIHLHRSLKHCLAKRRYRRALRLAADLETQLGDNKTDDFTRIEGAPSRATIAAEVKNARVVARRCIRRQRRWAAAICALLLLLFFLAWAGISKHRRARLRLELRQAIEAAEAEAHEQAYRHAKSAYEDALAENKTLLKNHGGDQWREVFRQSQAGSASSNDPITGRAAYDDACKGLPPAVKEAKRLQTKAELEAAVAKAEAAKKSGDWEAVESVVAQSSARLADAGPGAASAKRRLLDLAKKADAHLYPKLKIVALVDGREITGATIASGGKTWTSPQTFTLEKGKRYEFASLFMKRKNRRYMAEGVLITTNWVGVQTRRVTFRKYAGPFPGEDWTSPATGMEFVWIPKLECWAGKYEVTNGEYRKKEPTHDSGHYKKYLFGPNSEFGPPSEFDGLPEPGAKAHDLNGDRKPVVKVNFGEAKAYAKWLTRQDRDVLGGAAYRLPTEDEFMTYAQCGDGREYPWGDNWPPKSGQAGNYDDETEFDKYRVDGNYRDGHKVACGVEKSWKNPWGLYGVGGNVWEACASNTAADQSWGAWRGASSGLSHHDVLRCSYRRYDDASTRNLNYGFRVVLFR